MDIETISIIVGTRPQIIKSQPLVNELKKLGFGIKIINTGQHYDFKLSRKFFRDFKLIKPSINLGVGSGSQLEQIAKIITSLEKYFQKQKVDLVIVPGDTSSAIAGALAASKCKIKLAHLEAGARSNQFYMAEEINRRIIDHSSNLLFAPTKNCLNNLKNEKVFGKSFFVGDTMCDLFLNYKKRGIFKARNKEPNKILITIHRAENIENEKNLKKICGIINNLSKKYELTFPIHPHTRKKIKEFRLKVNANLVGPIGYFDLMKNLARSSLVITDSGGLQKEAYWMGKPCITLRESTEWIETVKENANFLSPISQSFPFNKMEKILNSRIKPNYSFYGNGNASRKIAKILLNN